MIEAVDASSRPAPPVRPSPSGAPVRIALSVAAGTAGLLGVLAWANGSFSRPAEPSRAGIVVSRLDDWPEIKNGVPEVRSRPALPEVSTAPPPAPEIRQASGAEAQQRKDVAGLIGVEPAGRLDVGPAMADGTGPPPLKEAAEPAAVSVERKLSGESPSPDAIRDPGTSQPQSVAVADPSVQGGAEIRPEGAATSPRESREGQNLKTRGAERPPGPQSQDARARKKAEGKPVTRPERKRTASAAPGPASEEAPASPPPADNAPAVEAGERVVVLGVPLPSGRRIKECLLDFRC